MSTDTKQITAADVVAFLKSLVPADYAGDISVCCCTSYHKPFVAQWVGRGRSGDNYFANTPEEAVAKVLANIKSPAALAEEKRAEAAKLLAEAQELDPTNPL